MRTSNAGFGEDRKLLQKHEVLVQPVALGGTRKMKLGILYKESEESDKVLETILCEDVRAALFGNDPRFPINTDPSKEIKQVNSTLIPFFTFTNYDLGFKVVWFIETETDRFYAATTNFGADKTYDMISPDGLPYQKVGLSDRKMLDPRRLSRIRRVAAHGRRERFAERSRSGEEIPRFNKQTLGLHQLKIRQRTIQKPSFDRQSPARQRGFICRSGTIPLVPSDEPAFCANPK